MLPFWFSDIWGIIVNIMAGTSQNDLIQWSTILFVQTLTDLVFFFQKFYILRVLFSCILNSYILHEYKVFYDTERQSFKNVSSFLNYSNKTCARMSWNLGGSFLGDLDRLCFTFSKGKVGRKMSPSYISL